MRVTTTMRMWSVVTSGTPPPLLLCECVRVRLVRLCVCSLRTDVGGSHLVYLTTVQSEGTCHGGYVDCIDVRCGGKQQVT